MRDQRGFGAFSFLDIGELLSDTEILKDVS